MKSRLFRYCVAAAGIDGAFYLTLTGVPYKAIKLGATPLVIGLLPAVWSVVYITVCGIGGHWSDRVPRIRMAALGTVVLVLSIALLALSPEIGGLFAGLALAAVGLALFWPALQAAIADEEPKNLDQDLGWFNISWSGGKSLGFLTGGAILAAHGFTSLFSLSGTIVLSVTLLLLLMAPRPPRESLDRDRSAPVSDDGVAASREENPGDDAGTVPADRRRRFLLMAWVANGASYGAAATLNYHYPRLLQDQGLGSDLFGSFLGLVYLSQTVTYFTLMRTTRWHYRRLPVYLAQAGLVVLLVCLPFLAAPEAALALAPLAGLGIGVSYFSSIYYSLHVSRTPGRNTGYHEAVIGSGTLIVPPLGGWLASRFGGLGLPFLLCAGVILLALLAEEVLFRRGGIPRQPTAGMRRR